LPDNLLEVKNLKAYYMTGATPVKAVDDVTLTVGRNEILGIVGESGCGKTTFTMAILRLLEPPARIVSGEVIFDDIDIYQLSPKELRRIRWKRISYIPQGSMNSLNPVLKVKVQMEDVIRAHEENINLSKHDLKMRIEQLLLNVGLAPQVSQMYPHELSGGMKQRVIISMATALNPEFIIADEPTTGLDVVVQRGILQLLFDIKNKLGASIIIVTHDMAVQAEIAERIVVMYAGRIAEVRKITNFFKNPFHPYSQALISSIPTLGQKRVLKGLLGAPPDLRYPPQGCKFHPRCPRAIMGVCDKKEPLLFEYKESLVACHLYK
jgi:peptide/nickel transport system ATP-binding protein